MITFDKNIDLSMLPLKDQYRLKMSQIQLWLNENDYIINKHTLGEYADDNPKWVEYIARRKAKLEEYNAYQRMISDIEDFEKGN